MAPKEDDDAPAAIPFREPGDLAKRIASGHAHHEHFPDRERAELAQMIQDALNNGKRRPYKL